MYLPVNSHTELLSTAGQVLTVNGDIAGFGPLTVAGAGEVLLSGNNTFIGGQGATCS
jgi:hypothetical protein